jgi:formylglycine-generating enzyme required for sulfatase activity
MEYLSQRAGLLLPRGVQVYTFPHRTFQEYLAACYLTDYDFPDQMAQLARQDPNRWREVALLAGAKAARGSASTIWLLVDALCENDYASHAIQTADIWGAHLAGQALAESGDLQQLNSRNQEKLVRVQDWLVYILSMSDFAASERASAGEKLARVGDPRQAVTTLEHMEFCFVPSGPFYMGSPKTDDLADGDEKPQHVNKHLNYDFWLSRFPITVAQYALFVEAAKHKPIDPNCLKDPVNWPVGYVTWHEAVMFCEWLTKHWRAQGVLSRKWRVQLPSEAEWEKAARGGRQVPKPPLVHPIAQISVKSAHALEGNEMSQRLYP